MSRSDASVSSGSATATIRSAGTRSTSGSSASSSGSGSGSSSGSNGSSYGSASPTRTIDSASTSTVHRGGATDGRGKRHGKRGTNRTSRVSLKKGHSKGWTASIKGIAGENPVGSGAVDALGNLITGLVEGITIQAAKLSRTAKRDTLGVTSIKAAIKIRFPVPPTGPSIMTNALDAGMSALTAFTSTRAGGSASRTGGVDRTKPIRAHVRAKLKLDVRLVRHVMSKYSALTRIGQTAPVYLAGAVESVVKYILQQARKLRVVGESADQQRISERSLAQVLGGSIELTAISRL